MAAAVVAEAGYMLNDGGGWVVDVSMWRSGSLMFRGS